MNIFGVIIPLIIKFVIDEIVITNNSGALSFIIIAIISSLMIEAFLSLVSNFNLKVLYENAEKTFKMIFLENIMKMSYQQFQYQKENEYLNNYIIDIRIVFEYVNKIIFIIFSTSLTFIIILTIMIVFNVKLTLLTLLFLPIYIIIVLISGNKMEKWYTKARDFYGKENDEIVNNLKCKKIINLYNAEHSQFEKINNLFHSVSNTAIDITYFEKIVNFFLYLLSNSGIVVIIIYGVKLILENKLTIGILVVFYSFSSKLIPMINNYIGFYYNLKQVKCSIRNLNKIMLKDNNYYGKINMLKFEQLKLDNIEVNIDGKTIIENFSMILNKGDILCLIGVNGSGKTTILNCISNLTFPSKGTIKIDNTILKNIDQSYYFDNICYFTQESYILNDTIYNNITMGKKIEHEKIYKICERLKIYDFILSQKDGFDFCIKNNGNEFSGGERKLLSFARILVKNPKILLLDEFTNDLDNERREIIFNCLKNDFLNSIIIFVTHNKNELKYSNKTIELRKL
jgi:ABC-type bacteriocin/lantibiotic exporter with double-glycine peptidase domain